MFYKVKISHVFHTHDLKVKIIADKIQQIILRIKNSCCKQ